VRQRGRRVLILHTVMRRCWQSEEIGCGLFAVGGWTGGGGFRASAFVLIQPIFEQFDGGGEVETHHLHQVDVVEVRVAVEAVGEVVAGVT